MFNSGSYPDISERFKLISHPKYVNLDSFKVEHSSIFSNITNNNQQLREMLSAESQREQERKNIDQYIDQRIPRDTMDRLIRGGNNSFEYRNILKEQEYSKEIKQIRANIITHKEFFTNKNKVFLF